MDDFEFGKFMVMNSLKHLAYAAVVYAVVLGAYWTYVA